MRMLGFVIFGIAIVLIVAGVVMFFLPEKQVSKPESTKTIKNESEKLEEVHCLDSICVEKMEVSYQEGQEVGSIRFYLQNTGEVNLPAGFVKVVFDNDNQKEFILRYTDFLPGDVQSVEIEFTEKDITETTDYQMQWLTEEELQNVNS